MPTDLVKHYAAEILTVLKYLHDHSTIHRDLKPENILIADDWHLKIVWSHASSYIGYF